MRFHFSTSPSKEQITFTYKNLVNGWLNKHLPTTASGKNQEHDKLSLYCVSNLKGASQRSSDYLNFPHGASLFVSFYSTGLARKFAQNVLAEPNLFADMKITNITIQETPVFSSSERFSVASPVLVKKFDGKTIRHLTFDNPEANDVMTKTMQTKLRAAGLGDHAESVHVRFDASYAGAKTKLVDIHGIKNRASVCPVIVEGSPEAVAFAWDVGVGHSTGAGFGALR